MDSPGGTAIVSLGANLGDSPRTIRAAASMLRDAFGSVAVRFSSLLISPPVGGPAGQDPFYNAACAVEGAAGVFELWHTLRQIESALGRRREHRWESRRIDLDILLFGSQRWWTPHLKVPHPRMATRSFAVLPAAEVAPRQVDPVSGLPLASLAGRLGYPERWTEQGTSLRPLRPGGRVLVFCVASVAPASLDRAYREQADRASPVEVEFIPLPADHLPDAASVAEIDRRVSRGDCLLLVLAARNPDPLAAAWEDYAASWAALLAMREAAAADERHPAPWPLAKYLLDCHDERWAAHELSAAVTAMTCSFEVACTGGSWAG